MLEVFRLEFYKSDLKEVGFSPRSAENWIETIEYIQSESVLKVNRASNFMTIELEEKKE